MNSITLDTTSLEEAFPSLPIRRVLGNWSSRSLNDHTQEVILACLAEIDEAAPEWTFVASRVYLYWMYEQSKANRKQRNAYDELS